MRQPRRPNALAQPVRAARPADLAYVCMLQKAHGEALGFIPRAALAQKIELGRVRLSLENGDPAGYLHHGSLAVPEVRIFQAAIQYDARRRHLGLALVDDLLARAGDAGARAVSLRCLSELDANDFWCAAGFRLLDTEPGARGTLNVWGRVLGEPAPESPAVPAPAVASSAAAFPFHSRLHPCPRCGRWTTDTWARGARRFALCPACLAGGR
jgi:ribosomal protein S18 acetylase RimI-like enzyme